MNFQPASGDLLFEPMFQVPPRICDGRLPSLRLGNRAARTTTAFSSLMTFCTLKTLSEPPCSVDSLPEAIRSTDEPWKAPGRATDLSVWAMSWTHLKPLSTFGSRISDLLPTYKSWLS